VRHFYGALNLRTGQEFALPLPAQTAEMTVHFLRHLLSCFPQQPILLLLDRAPWHRGQPLEQLLSEQPRLELLYFPPACPDLNPQELVWEQTRDAISHDYLLTILLTYAPLFSAIWSAPCFPSISCLAMHHLDCMRFYSGIH
jgi:transposase